MANLKTLKRFLINHSSLLFDPMPSLKTSSYFATRTFKNTKIAIKADSFVEEDKFRTLRLGKREERIRQSRSKFRTQMLPPRYTRMPVDQDWTNVWPAARTFNPSVVPFPVRQGYTQKDAPPGKFGNAELMKIPNFLHLTPPAIKKHCAAIKKFCTPWPKELHTDELCEKHFPIEVITNDYCHSGPSSRDPKARIVTLKVRLNNLSLDYHAKDKLLRLVGDRYDSNTDILTVMVDRCPLKKQNYDYGYYLLTALYHESKKTEPWESEKTDEDMEKYVWTQDKSYFTIRELILKFKDVDKKQNLSDSSSFSWLKSIPEDCPSESLPTVEPVGSYADFVTQIYNEGENAYRVSKYKASVKALLGLPLDADTCMGESSS